VRWGEGAYGGLFLVCYGLVRTVLELFRQPDAQFTGNGDTLGTVLGPLTMGQVLSLLTAAVGLFFLVRGIRTPPPAEAPASPAAAK
jgi:phosphatidylglycerol:prolipoprotein diacylglycerol transferase